MHLVLCTAPQKLDTIFGVQCIRRGVFFFASSKKKEAEKGGAAQRHTYNVVGRTGSFFVLIQVKYGRVLSFTEYDKIGLEMVLFNLLRRGGLCVRIF